MLSSVLIYFPNIWFGDETLGKAVSLVLVSICVVGNATLVIALFKRVPLFQYWVAWAILWPCALVPFAPHYHAMELLGRVMFVEFLVAGTVLSLKLGAQHVALAARLALWTAVFGVFWSYLDRDFLENVAFSQIGASDVAAISGRAWGFRLQPNYLAADLCMLLLLSLHSLRSESSIKEAHRLAAITAIAILMTGSRGGMLCFAGVVSVVFGYGVLVSRDRHIFHKYSAIVAYVGVSGLVLLAVFGDGVISSNIVMLERAAEVVDYLLGTMGDDGSLNERRMGAAAILARVAEHPVFGHGCGGMRALWETGRLPIVAHDTFQYYLLDYGAAYMLSFLVLLVATLAVARKHRVSEAHGIAFVPALAAVTVLAGLVSMSVKSPAWGYLLGVGLAGVLSAQARRSAKASRPAKKRP
ncbi:MAG: hypothetical protein B7733_16220 [Myxococcales bacterium FL481]|nr:MAG: hypothetical protein B7733_16220 [Myxococcales bacterium FL481]